MLLSDAWRAYQVAGIGTTGRNEFRKVLKEEFAGDVVEDKKHPARSYVKGVVLDLEDDS